MRFRLPFTRLSPAPAAQAAPASQDRAVAAAALAGRFPVPAPANRDAALKAAREAAGTELGILAAAAGPAAEPARLRGLLDEHTRAVARLAALCHAPAPAPRTERPRAARPANSQELAETIDDLRAKATAAQRAGNTVTAEEHRRQAWEVYRQLNPGANPLMEHYLW